MTFERRSFWSLGLFVLSLGGSIGGCAAIDEKSSQGNEHARGGAPDDAPHSYPASYVLNHPSPAGEDSRFFPDPKPNNAPIDLDNLTDGASVRLEDMPVDRVNPAAYRIDDLPPLPVAQPSSAGSNATSNVNPTKNNVSSVNPVNVAGIAKRSAATSVRQQTTGNADQAAAAVAVRPPLALAEPSSLEPASADPKTNQDSNTKPNPKLDPKPSVDSPAQESAIVANPTESAADLIKKLQKYAHEQAKSDPDRWTARAELIDSFAADLDGRAKTMNDRLDRLSKLIKPEPAPADRSIAVDSHQGSSEASTNRDETFESSGKAKPFRLRSARFCEKISGFGVYAPTSSTLFKAGQDVLVYCEPEAIAYQTDSDGFRSRIASRVAIVGESSIDPVWSEDMGVVEDVCRSRRRDYFVNFRVSLPESLAPGGYRLKVSQADLIGGSEASTEIPFVIK